MDAIKEIENLRVEVDGILSRYGVPMDDRTLIADRVEKSVNEILEDQRQAFISEIGKVRSEIDAEREKTAGMLGNIKSAARNQAGRKLLGAYRSGLEQGLKESKGPGLLQVLLSVGVLGLAAFVVIQGLFRR